MTPYNSSLTKGKAELNGALKTPEQKLSSKDLPAMLHELGGDAWDKLTEFPIPDSLGLTDSEKKEFIYSMRSFYDNLSKASEEINRKALELGISDNSDPKEIARWEETCRAILGKHFHINVEKPNWFKQKMENILGTRLVKI